MKTLFLLLSVSMFLASCKYSKSDVTVYPAPEGEALNTKYKVSVNSINVPVYNAKICTEDMQGRHAAGVADLSDLNYDIAGFASFDLKKGPAKVTVSVDDYIYTAKILP